MCVESAAYEVLCIRVRERRLFVVCGECSICNTLYTCTRTEVICSVWRVQHMQYFAYVYANGGDLQCVESATYDILCIRVRERT